MSPEQLEERIKELSLEEEVAVKWRELVGEFNALKVQILIKDDELPANAVNVLDLERLQAVLEDVPAPTRVYVDGKVYKVKLRKRVSREEYKAFMGKLERLGRAWWDRNERVIKVLRYEERGEVEETPEVPVIVPGRGKVGVMRGGGVK